MFELNRKGPEDVPALVAGTHIERDFLDAVDAVMIKELGRGLDRPDYSRLWVLVPNAIAAERFSFPVKIHSSWAGEAADYCQTLRSLGGECTDPVVEGEELSFTMTIQPSNAKMSPVGDGRVTPTLKFRQIPCPW
jgi:hypothetical protein